jgi:GntR family transcriptional regulator/MocR family aminotransferase
MPIYLLAEALFDAQQRVGLEDPATRTHATASPCARRSLYRCRVDAQGLIVDDLPRMDYCFVTPSHQSPTTHTMSMDRRTALVGAG